MQHAFAEHLGDAKSWDSEMKALPCLWRGCVGRRFLDPVLSGPSTGSGWGSSPGSAACFSDDDDGDDDRCLLSTYSVLGPLASCSLTPQSLQFLLKVDISIIPFYR